MVLVLTKLYFDSQKGFVIFNNFLNELQRLYI